MSCDSSRCKEIRMMLLSSFQLWIFFKTIDDRQAIACTYCTGTSTYFYSPFTEAIGWCVGAHNLNSCIQASWLEKTVLTSIWYDDCTFVCVCIRRKKSANAKCRMQALLFRRTSNKVRYRKPPRRPTLLFSFVWPRNDQLAFNDVIIILLGLLLLCLFFRNTLNRFIR